MIFNSSCVFDLQTAYCIIKEMLKEFQESLTESFRNTNRTKLRYFHDDLLETFENMGL